MKSLLQSEVFHQWESRLVDPRARTTIAARLFRLANGLAGDVKPVGQGISELRIHYGPGYRIYFRDTPQSIILLLCGGDKRTQQADIALAKRLARDWLQDMET